MPSKILCLCAAALLLESCVVKHADSGSADKISDSSHPLKASLLCTYFDIPNCVADFNVVGDVISIVDSTYSCSTGKVVPSTGNLVSVEAYQFNDANQLVLANKWGSDFVYKYCGDMLVRFSLANEVDDPCGNYITYKEDSVIVNYCEGEDCLVLNGGKPAKLIRSSSGDYTTYSFSQDENSTCMKLVSVESYESGDVEQFSDSVVALIDHKGRKLNAATSYDEFGNMIKSSGAKYSYEFDENNNWIESLRVNADGSSVLTTRRIQYRK